MKQGAIIAIMISVVLVLAGIIIALVLLNPKTAAPGIIAPEAGNQNSSEAEMSYLDPFCPSKLRISTYVVTKNTKNKSDDEVWISILNPDPREYSARISVNQVFEEEGTIPSGSQLEIISKQITEWWTAPSVVEKDGEVYISTSDRTNTFNIEVIVKDCEKQILLVTPGDPTGTGGGSIGGAGGGGGSLGGTTIKITRTTEQNLND